MIRTRLSVFMSNYFIRHFSWMWLYFYIFSFFSRPIFINFVIFFTIPNPTEPLWKKRNTFLYLLTFIHVNYSITILLPSSPPSQSICIAAASKHQSLTLLAFQWIHFTSGLQECKALRAERRSRRLHLLKCQNKSFKMLENIKWLNFIVCAWCDIGMTPNWQVTDLVS